MPRASPLAKNRDPYAVVATRTRNRATATEDFVIGVRGYNKDIHCCFTQRSSRTRNAPEHEPPRSQAAHAKTRGAVRHTP